MFRKKVNQRWLEKLKAEDQDAFKRLYKHLYQQNEARIKAILKERNGFPEDLKDIFQESIFALLIKIRRDFDLARGSVEGYFWRICSRKINDWVYQKKFSAAENADLPADAEHPDMGFDLKLELEERRIWLMKKVKELGERCQKLLTLYYFESKGYSEITGIFEYGNPNTARLAVFRCNERLRKKIRKYGRENI